VAMIFLIPMFKCIRWEINERLPFASTGVRFVFNPSCFQEGACLIYVICVCLRIVVSNTCCVMFLGIHQHPVWAQRGSQNEQSRETGNTCHTRQRKAKQKHNTTCVGHHNTQTNTNNVNKTCALLKTTVSPLNIYHYGVRAKHFGSGVQSIKITCVLHLFTFSLFNLAMN
jgi:hypothetical protein